MRKNKGEQRSVSRWIWITASALLAASSAVFIYWAVQTGMWSFSSRVSSTPAAAKAALAPSSIAQTETTAEIKLLGQARTSSSLSANERKLLEKLHGYQLEPGRLYSFLQWMEENGSGVQVTQQEQSRVASLLYEAALRGGLEVGERHPHAALPAGVAPGFDTEIKTKGKDLTIYNPWQFPVKLETTLASGETSLSLKGAADPKWKAPQVKVEQQTLNPETILLADHNTTSRTTKQQGSPGMAVTVLCDCMQPGQEKVFSKDVYLPEFVIIQEPAALVNVR
jgi:hypothetical protein